MALRVIILSGGRSSRFGGVHKPGVDLGGRTVISRILTAVRELDPAAEVWVAGPVDGLSRAEADTVRSVREDPEFAGPLAGIAAACAAIVDSDGTAGTDGATDGAAGADASPVGAASSAVTGSPGPEAGDTTVVIAGDMPNVTASHLGDLVEMSTRHGAPVAGSDDRGRAQFLCAAWPTRLLRARLEGLGDPRDRAVKLLFADGEPILVAVDPDVVVDFDTAEELARIRARLSR